MAFSLYVKGYLFPYLSRGYPAPAVQKWGPWPALRHKVPDCRIYPWATTRGRCHKQVRMDASAALQLHYKKKKQDRMRRTNRSYRNKTSKLKYLLFSSYRRDCVIASYQKHAAACKAQEPMVGAQLPAHSDKWRAKQTTLTETCFYIVLFLCNDVTLVIPGNWRVRRVQPEQLEAVPLETESEASRLYSNIFMLETRRFWVVTRQRG